jgi:hypothetical protein
MSILKIYYNGTRIKKMVSRKMGRYRSTKERWSSIRSVEENLQALQKESTRKCVPLAKATQMSASQKASAVKRKRSAPNTGPKPTFVKTLTKKYYGGLIKI